MPTEKAKARRFVKGLKKGIRQFMLSQIPVTFREAHLTARRHELDAGVDVEVLESQPIPERESKFLKEGQSSRNTPYSRPVQSDFDQQRESLSGGLRCSACGIPGHTIENCWKANGLCLGCGSSEHRIASCEKIHHRVGSDGGLTVGSAAVLQGSVSAGAHTQSGSQSRRSRRKQNRARGRVLSAVAKGEE